MAPHILGKLEILLSGGCTTGAGVVIFRWAPSVTNADLNIQEENENNT